MFNFRAGTKNFAAIFAVSIASLIALAPSASARYFADTSFWNTPLSAQSTLDARSSTWAQHIVSKVATYGSWINTTSYSMPVYTVPADQPLVRVWIDLPAATYDSDFYSVPVPANMVPAAGNDGYVMISQPSTDTVWELLLAHKDAGGNWHAKTAGRMLNVSQSNGIYPSHPYDQPYGASGSELPIYAGMITPQELQSGNIDHEVVLSLPHTLLRWWWSYPASHSDGDSVDPYDVPEGTRFRLPASLDISKLGLSPVAATIARAAQKYGIIVTDSSTVVHFYAQDPVNMPSNPYPALFGGKTPAQVLAGFPWGSLQALPTQPNQALPF